MNSIDREMSGDLKAGMKCIGKKSVCSLYSTQIKVVFVILITWNKLERTMNCFSVGALGLYL